MAKRPVAKRGQGGSSGSLNEHMTIRAGRSGLQQTGGWIHEEFAGELRGLKGAKTFKNIADNTTTVGAFLFAITMLLRNASWTVKAVDESAEAADAKELVEGMMGDMATSWADMVDEICTMFVYGYAPMEVTWKVRQGPNADPLKASRFTDRLLAPAAIELRSQLTLGRWVYDDEQVNVVAMEQWLPTGMVQIPRERLALFRTSKVLDNPEGKSLLRTIWRAHAMVTKMENVEAIGAERDLAGYPVFYLPSALFDAGASVKQKQELASYQNLVTKIRRDQSEGICLPSTRDRNGNLTHELKLLSSGGARAIPTPAIIDRYHRHIATAVLADFLFLGQAAVGSFALSSDKTALFAAAIGGFGRSIADTYCHEVVRPFWQINALDPVLMPSVSMGDLETADMGQIAALLTSMAGAGAMVFPDRELENHLRRMAGLPEAPEDGGDMADRPGQTDPGETTDAVDQ